MQLWKMTASGTDPSPVAPFSVTDVHVSSDGNFLFFTNAGEGLWQMSSSGGNVFQVRGLEQCRFGRLWTVTDRGVYYVDIKIDRSKLQFYDFRTQTSRPILRLQADTLIGYPSLSYSISEDSILFAAKEDVRSDLMVMWTKHQ